MELAPLKVADRVVTADVIHESKPFPVNFDALENVLPRVWTFATFHVPKLAFIELAWVKVERSVVTADVIHESKPPPVNFDALQNVSCRV